MSEIEGDDEAKAGELGTNTGEDNDLSSLGRINSDPAVQQIYGAKRKAYIETSNPHGGGKSTKTEFHEKRTKEKEVSYLPCLMLLELQCK